VLLARGQASWWGSTPRPAKTSRRRPRPWASTSARTTSSIRHDAAWTVGWHRPARDSHTGQPRPVLHAAPAQLLDDVRAMMSEALPRVVTTTVTGSAEVLARFEIGLGSNQTMSIAGCRIKDGSLLRNGTFRLFRNGRQIHEGGLDVPARPRRGSVAPDAWGVCTERGARLLQAARRRSRCSRRTSTLWARAASAAWASRCAAPMRKTAATAQTLTGGQVTDHAARALERAGL